jgi:hypothetical protein
MRLRCPNQGCLIEVPDDMLGARMRCPQCGQLFFADARDREDASPPPAPPGPVASEHRLHEGLPPLAKMLAVRAGRGPAWPDDRALRAEMTPDDWRALAAFEKVVAAVHWLQLSLRAGVAVAVVAVLLCVAGVQGRGSESEAFQSRLIAQLAALALLGPAFLLMAVGWRRLARLRIGTLVQLASWAVFGVALVFAVSAAVTLRTLLDDRYHQRGPELLATPFQLSTAVLAGLTGLWVRRALKQVRPPEILGRLVEALSYLESTAGP